MLLKEIKELMDKMTQTGMNVVEIEEAGSRLRLERSATADCPPAAGQEIRSATAAATPVVAVIAATPAEPVVPAQTPGFVVVSPVVGIYFSSPTPDSAPFVKVGSKVETGSPLCIIEAMKLMNEVTSSCDGTVLEIMAQNGQRVEYGQPLMRIGGN